MLREAEAHRGRLDVLGAALGKIGLAALVFAIKRVGEQGKKNTVVLSAFGGAVVLLAAFLARQARADTPILPSHLFSEPRRSDSYLTILLLGFGPMGAFFLLTFYMQHVLRYSAIQTGTAWLPFGVGIVVAAGISSKLIVKIAPGLVIAAGALICASDIFWLSCIGADTGYVTHLLPGFFAMAFGLGLAAIPLTLTVVQGVRTDEAGIAWPSLTPRSRSA